MLHRPSRRRPLPRQARTPALIRRAGAENLACLRDPFPIAPRLLLKEHGSELAQPVGAIDQHLKDVVAFCDRQRQNLDLFVTGRLAPVSSHVELGVSEKPSQGEDKPIGNRYAPKEHPSRVLLARGARVSVRNGQVQAVTRMLRDPFEGSWSREPTTTVGHDRSFARYQRGSCGRCPVPAQIRLLACCCSSVFRLCGGSQCKRQHGAELPRHRGDRVGASPGRHPYLEDSLRQRLAQCDRERHRRGHGYGRRARG